MFHISRVVAHTSAEQYAAVDSKALGIPWNSQVVHCTAKLMLLNHTKPLRVIVK
jgi:hypothetical protein